MSGIHNINLINYNIFATFIQDVNEDSLDELQESRVSTCSMAGECWTSCQGPACQSSTFELSTGTNWARDIKHDKVDDQSSQGATPIFMRTVQESLLERKCSEEFVSLLSPVLNARGPSLHKALLYLDETVRSIDSFMPSLLK